MNELDYETRKWVANFKKRFVKVVNRIFKQDKLKYRLMKCVKPKRKLKRRENNGRF